MSQEEVYYSDERGTRVSNRRLIINGTTYVLRNITSTSVDKVSGHITFGDVVSCIFAFIAPLIFDSSTYWPLSGLIAIGVSVYLYLKVRSSYVLKIGSASGESEAIKTREKDYVRKVSRAINEAIIQDGQRSSSRDDSMPRYAPMGNREAESQPSGIEAERSGGGSPSAVGHQHQTYNQQFKSRRPRRYRRNQDGQSGSESLWMKFKEDIRFTAAALTGAAACMIIFALFAFSASSNEGISHANPAQQSITEPTLYVVTQKASSFPREVAAELDTFTESFLQQEGYSVPQEQWHEGLDDPYLHIRYHLNSNWFSLDEITIEMALFEPDTTPSGMTRYIASWGREQTMRVDDVDLSKIRSEVADVLKAFLYEYKNSG